MIARLAGSRAFALAFLLLAMAQASAQVFGLPTSNRALFEKDGEERFFVGTVGKPWMSGTFGCVRSGGWQIHEGLDIRCLHRDKKGEAIDPVLATADGTVVYFSTKPSLSNYGIYLVLRHQIEGIEIYSLYAHLREVRADLKIGQSVKRGENLATMGRTTNTREGISKDRAHVHFELNLFYNDRFESWHKKTSPNQRNDHGVWNGQNFVGLDPRQLLLEAHAQGDKFSLTQFIRHQTELCRVTVRVTSFPWLKRYPQLVKSNPRAEKEGIAGYEMALNFNALPYELIPRAASELKGRTRFNLLSVNDAEQKKNPGRRLVTQKSKGWELSTAGLNVLDLLTH